MSRDESAELVWWAVEIFRDRWFVLVFHRLLAGPRRQAELLREIDGISQRMLTRTLRHMERDALVSRRTIRLKPLHVEYELTGLGSSIKPVLEAILRWAHQSEPAIAMARSSSRGNQSQ